MQRVLKQAGIRKKVRASALQLTFVDYLLVDGNPTSESAMFEHQLALLFPWRESFGRQGTFENMR